MAKINNSRHLVSNAYTSSLDYNLWLTCISGEGEGVFAVKDALSLAKMKALLKMEKNIDCSYVCVSVRATSTARIPTLRYTATYSPSVEIESIGYPTI